MNEQYQHTPPKLPTGYSPMGPQYPLSDAFASLWIGRSREWSMGVKGISLYGQTPQEFLALLPEEALSVLAFLRWVEPWLHQQVIALSLPLRQTWDLHGQRIDLLQDAEDEDAIRLQGVGTTTFTMRSKGTAVTVSVTDQHAVAAQQGQPVSFSLVLTDPDVLEGYQQGNQWSQRGEGHILTCQDLIENLRDLVQDLLVVPGSENESTFKWSLGTILGMMGSTHMSEQHPEQHEGEEQP